MNINKQGFKENIVDAVFKIAGAAWLKISIAYAIYLISAISILAVLFIGIFKIDFSGIYELKDPEDLINFFKNIDFSFVTPSFYIIVFIFSLLIGIIVSWCYYFSFILINDKVNEIDSDFNTLFHRSINIGVLQLFGIFLSFSIITVLALVISGILRPYLGGGAIILGLVFIVAIYRLLLIVPSIIIGKKTLIESITYSFTQITWIRAIKLFGITIVAVVAIFIAFLIIGLFSMVFDLIPVFGKLIQLGIHIFINGFLISLVVSVFIGLYYRYIKDDI